MTLQESPQNPPANGQNVQAAPREKKAVDPLNVSDEVNYVKRLRRDFRRHYNEVSGKEKQGWARLILSASDLLYKLRDWRFEERLTILEDKFSLTVAQQQQEVEP